MDTFVEEFASKLDEAKALALKMTLNQEVEVLKYVFLFVEQLQKDLIDKLTIKGSLVTFSFTPEMGIGNGMQNIFVTPDIDTTYIIKRRTQERYNTRCLPTVKDEEEDVEKFDGFRQTCDELDEHYFQHFSETRKDADRLSGASDCGVQGKEGLSESSEKELNSTSNDSDRSVSLICLAGPKSRTVSPCCNRTRASLSRSKTAADEIHAVPSVVCSPTKSEICETTNNASNSDLNNGLEASTLSPRNGFDATPVKRSRLSAGRKCRRERVGGKYTCSFPGCSEKYSNLEHVADHELQHTVPGGHVWSCSQCPQKFKWRHYLRIHLKLQHSCNEVAPVEMPVS